MMNVVALMGRFTYEPELKTTPSGVSVIRFQLAVDRSYQKSGEERKADFIDCIAWRQTAEFISRYFHKGDMIAIDGTLQTTNFTDKEGNKRKSIEVLANNVSFCGSKNANASTSEASYSSNDNSDFEEIVDEDEDLPF